MSPSQQDWPRKANAAVAIIARDAAKTIGACLDSLVPHVRQVVVCVDELTTDDTAAVALKHGAKVVQGHTVSEWHECKEHGRVLAQDFAKARNLSFEYLDPDEGQFAPAAEWLGWVDSDDVVEGGERLASLLGSLPPEIGGVFLPYQYASTPNGHATTQFDRERFVRRSVDGTSPEGAPRMRGWRWRNRVHEVLESIDRPIESVPLSRSDLVRVVHQGAGHDNDASARRNILLLEIMLEEKPGDSWALSYLGNQYFALSEHAKAIECFEASLDTPNVYQRWVTHLYRSYCYEALGDLQSAGRAAFEALELRPEHSDPYYRLAAIAMLRGDGSACETWTELGDQRGESPALVFKNPMDRPFNSRVALGQAYLNDGEPGKALRLWKAANAVQPTESLREGILTCERLLRDGNSANALVEVLRGKADSEVRALLPVLAPSPDVWAFGRLRDRVAPALIRTRHGTSPSNTQPHGTSPRIVFWCGRSGEPWGPPSLTTTGIGGSETAVVEIARRFARAGWRADVYNEPDRYEGEHDGVGYWSLGRLGKDERADVLVSWRNPGATGLPVAARLRLLWLHDLNSGPAAAEHLSRWDRVLGVSEWHRAYLVRQYGLSEERTDFVPNGIVQDRFTRTSPVPEVKKVPFRCVYASAPDRGLARLLRLWPELRASEPTAELHVAYGWETTDRAIALGAHYLIPQKAEIERLLAKTSGVVWRGRLPQDQLARLYQESYAWLYPTHFTEVSCISAMEAMAAGCVPVTSAVGALVETIGDGGLVVSGNPYSGAWEEFWTACARAALFSPDVRLPLAERGRARAKALSWDSAFEAWQKMIEGLLK